MLSYEHRTIKSHAHTLTSSYEILLSHSDIKLKILKLTHKQRAIKFYTLIVEHRAIKSYTHTQTLSYKILRSHRTSSYKILSSHMNIVCRPRASLLRVGHRLVCRGCFGSVPNGGSSNRPVSKHGPKSPTCLLGMYLTKPKGATKVKVSYAAPWQDPVALYQCRVAGLSRRHRS